MVPNHADSCFIREGVLEGPFSLQKIQAHCYFKLCWLYNEFTYCYNLSVLISISWMYKYDIIGKHATHRCSWKWWVLMACRYSLTALCWRIRPLLLLTKLIHYSSTRNAKKIHNQKYINKQSQTQHTFSSSLAYCGGRWSGDHSCNSSSTNSSSCSLASKKLSLRTQHLRRMRTNICNVIGTEYWA